MASSVTSHAFPNRIQNTMTVTETPVFEHSEGIVTLPDLPDEYLEVSLIENDKVQVEEIVESYTLAISDVTEGRILCSKKLTEGENVKEIYLVELSANYSSFRPGDTIGIVTQNRKKDVQKLFNHLKISHLSEKKCKVREKKSSIRKKPSPLAFIDKVTTLNHIFTYCLDIQCIPKKSLIRVLSEYANDSKEKRKLEELCSKENSDLYIKTVLDLNKTFLDILLMFPSSCPPAVRLIENLPKLLPRLYSIANSPLATPDRVKVIFSLVKTENGKEGLCTGMLKEIINDKKADKMVKMFFRKCNGFNLPEVEVPLILVGPGTGIAPFMGFLEHRKIQKTKGIIWLFYGCRLRESDYLFREELEEYVHHGILSKLCVAFSRECDAEAKYVQDNIRKYGQEISSLIFEQSAMIYVCGDAKNMKKDVLNTFVEVFEKHKGMTNKEATDYVKRLQKEKRYLQDIWI